MSLREILIRLLMLSLLMAGIIGVLSSLNLLGQIGGFCWACLGFFAGVSLIIFLMAAFIASRSSTFNFTNVLMLAIIARMLFSGIFIVLYIVKFSPPGIIITIPFFLLYFIYTWFENSHLLKYAQYLGR